MVANFGYTNTQKENAMKYEVATNQPAENKAIIARILAGETVQGAFLRGTGKVYQQHEIRVTTDKDGALVLSGGMNTHNGQIQERFSTLICEYCPACDRANEINRGATMTDAEKAEMKHRREIGVIAAGRESWKRNLASDEATAAKFNAMTTARDYANHLGGIYVSHFDRIEEDKPGSLLDRLKWEKIRAQGSVDYDKKELKKLDKREAQQTK